jgi:hypothetical protein
MKSFKNFIQLDEIEQPKYAHGKEAKFAKSTFMAEPKDPADQLKTGPEEVGPKGVKTGAGKRRADQLNNKQPFDEDAYATIKAKMKENVDATEVLFSLYENLSAENQEMFLTRLESDADALLDFATISKVE